MRSNYHDVIKQTRQQAYKEVHTARAFNSSFVLLTYDTRACFTRVQIHIVCGSGVPPPPVSDQSTYIHGGRTAPKNSRELERIWDNKGQF